MSANPSTVNCDCRCSGCLVVVNQVSPMRIRLTPPRFVSLWLFASACHGHIPPCGTQFPLLFPILFVLKTTRILDLSCLSAPSRPEKIRRAAVAIKIVRPPRCVWTTCEAVPSRDAVNEFCDHSSRSHEPCTDGRTQMSHEQFLPAVGLACSHLVQLLLPAPRP